MVINIGWLLSPLRRGVVHDVICPNCKKTADMSYVLYTGYVNVVIIPFFPARKAEEIICSECGKKFHFHQITRAIRKKIMAQEKLIPVKKPLWQYTGAILSAIIIIAGIITGVLANANENEYIKNPKPNDVYRVKSVASKQYTTLKVQRINGDNVCVYVNDMETSDYSGINEINVPKNYNKLQIVSKLKLEKMYSDNEIYQIDRE